ncbi:leucine-rich repeat, immunoglobulin-like domain and transmembrane domain-containing protein 2 [Betta splendens]|uniref:leucine-rich repeat, immunoglobulin-like domain and transmembrane domain-containing protein 2 n=1 Tax=Betta splendens TaxID=158456 RepID=UPI001B3B45A5|nr:leucine-rich repeat, immunoglobulin-like domain and transmembrane domain-containing protein 2 [Betta splendens]
MDARRVALRFILAFHLIASASSTCVIGCSCTDDNLGRSLLCTEASMEHIPEDMPHDFSKVRIEKCHLTELPPGSLSRLGALEFLWLNFNEIRVMNMESLKGLANLTELRLQGNRLTSVPWTAFQDTPRLKILDLKHNSLDALPEDALSYLPALTYLDLSFNRLSVISRDVFIHWPLYQAAEKAWGKEGLVSNVVLALHDNPWLCDCHLKGFVDFVRTVSPPIILMSSYLMCSGPVSKAGKFFHDTQLKTCMKPQTSAPETNVTLPLGAKATLACSIKARPRATIQWIHNQQIMGAFAAIETHIDDDSSSSQLVIPSLQPPHQGLYTCIASNFMGNSSVNITVNIPSSSYSAPPPPPVPMRSDNAAHIDVRIAKQTAHGITLEWTLTTDNPAATWLTLHFGKYDSPRKETIYVGPGISSHSFADLLPVTKYEACVTLRGRPPRGGRCVVFVTGSNAGELEQRARLLHVIVLVSAVLVAVPAGVYACTTGARISCVEQCAGLWKERRRRREGGDSFDGVQAASDEGLCRHSKEKRRGKSEERCKGSSAAYLY